MDKEELRARIRDEGAGEWRDGGETRDGGGGVLLYGEVGEAVGHWEDGRRWDIIRCRHGGLEGKETAANKSPRRSHKFIKHALSQTFYTPTTRPPSLPFGHQGLALYVSFARQNHPLTASHPSHTRPTHTCGDTRLVPRRDRTQQAPHRHREHIYTLPLLAVSCSPGRNRKPPQHCQP